MRKLGYLLIALLLTLPLPALGLMSSTNYTIFADSVDAGGSYSSGGAYGLEDTLGESATDVIDGSTYTIRGGYQAMDWDFISLTISSSSLDLGLANVSQVNQASTTATVTTESPEGYDLTVSNVTGTHLTDVADGAVTAGSEEYGVAVSGANASFDNDRGLAIGLSVASSTIAATAAATVLTFKAAISGVTTFGIYTQTITLTAANKI